jgi:hypothetical protein
MLFGDKMSRPANVDTPLRRHADPFLPQFFPNGPAQTFGPPLAAAGALLGVCLPAVTRLSLDGFLSQIGILFIFPFLVSLLLAGKEFAYGWQHQCLSIVFRERRPEVLWHQGQVIARLFGGGLATVLSSSRRNLLSERDDAPRSLLALSAAVDSR